MRDFLQTSDGDLDFSGGDIQMTESTLQHERDIIMTSPGALKHSPSRGVGIENYFNDESPEDLLRKTRQEMERDGIRVQKIALNQAGTMEILGRYEND